MTLFDDVPLRWPHQEEDLNASWQLPAAALHYEPRCGKSRVAIDTLQRAFAYGHADAAIVVAPAGVHLNWTREELPRWWVGLYPTVVEWLSRRAGTAAFRRELEAALVADWPVVVVNAEALATPRLVNLTGRGKPGYLERLVKRRRCALVVDEGHLFKNPRAKRTRALLRLAPSCRPRRVLDGTPVAQGPFDLWAPFQVLDPDVLGRRYTTFKHRYGVFEKRRYGTGPLHDELVEYRNLDELAERIAPITFTRKKADVLPGLPPRLMKPGSDVLGVPRFFELPPAHARVYRELRDDLVARLDGGEELTAARAVTNLLRLHQVSRGHATTDDGRVVRLPGPYPAVEAAVELARDHPGKTIFWCRFVPDVDLLTAALLAANVAAVRCDGTIPADERPELRRAFREDDDVLAWVGTPDTGGVGVDLGAADLMVFYSHDYKLVTRLQALERNYGSSQTSERVEVVDLVAADTVDLRALARLEAKEDLARTLTGGALRELLT